MKTNKINRNDLDFLATFMRHMSANWKFLSDVPGAEYYPHTTYEIFNYEPQIDVSRFNYIYVTITYSTSNGPASYQVQLTNWQVRNGNRIIASTNKPREMPIFEPTSQYISMSFNFVSTNFVSLGYESSHLPGDLLYMLMTTLQLSD